MKEQEIEYFLGRREHNGYEIIEHNTSRPQGEGTCVFDVCEHWISDGDGHPAIYNDTYVKIDEEVYKHAIDMFHSAATEMKHIGSEITEPMSKDPMIGDYIKLRGVFLKIVNFDQGLPIIESFEYDFYTIDYLLKQHECWYSVDELQDEGHLITQEIYEKALSVAREAALRIKAYLYPYLKK